ncbi:MAG: hypothetical protein F6J89_20530 [Symploca sp. SIO1C4]|uniref:Uncharacterized protein n=1 Tax=Symploca sp. SIO1C4 TaxID=2607765 RepID=A0A6B3N8J4_9CYAN|nr:hypothetical protein [Symploca sp. SIO1C4]
MNSASQSVTKFASTLLKRISLGFGVCAVAFSLTSILGSQSASAQTVNDVQPLEDFEAGQNERDPFSGTGGWSPFDLIHRARLGNSRDLNEYVNEQRESLKDAAAEFRRLQLEQLGVESQFSPENQSTTSESEENTQQGN